MKRSFLLAALLVLGVATALPAQAAKFPTKEVRVIVPWNPGGNNDLMARFIQPIMEKNGMKIIVENVPGGTGAIGMGQVAIAKPDGYTVGWQTSSTLSVIAEGKVPLKLEQFTSIVRASEDPLLILVSKNSPRKTLKQFIEYMKANPGKATIGTPGSRNVNEILAVMTSRAAGVAYRNVPYPGGSRVVAELMGGQIDAGVLKPGEVMEVVKSGELIPIGAFTAERIKTLPNVPTFKELGYDVFPYGPVPQMSYIAAPAGIPADVRAVLIDQFRKAFQSPEFQAFAAQNAFVSDGLSGNDLDKVAAETTKTLGIAARQVFQKK